MDITCIKPGYKAGHVVAISHFTGKTVGNVLAGGVIGMGVDAASGANFHYDSPITAPLGDRDAGQMPAPAAMHPYTGSPNS